MFRNDVVRLAAHTHTCTDSCRAQTADTAFLSSDHALPQGAIFPYHRASLCVVSSIVFILPVYKRLWSPGEELSSRVILATVSVVVPWKQDDISSQMFVRQLFPAYLLRLAMVAMLWFEQLLRMSPPQKAQVLDKPLGHSWVCSLLEEYYRSCHLHIIITLQATACRDYNSALSQKVTLTTSMARSDIWRIRP